MSALRIALEPLADEPVTESIVLAMLREASLALADERRNVTDTVNLLRQMRSMLPLTAELDGELDDLTDAHMLAQVGIGPPVDEVEARIRASMAKWRQKDPPAAA
ncbi:MAG: hypothetical protein K8S21_12295 [Gemmatimonadetes bacterium]|nr:hypothetical protein [Gemmatimonadota bacterium]